MGWNGEPGRKFPAEQENDETDLKVKKYLRGEGANLEALQDKKLKGQLAVGEELYGKSAKGAAKIEKWLMPSEGGYLEAEDIEKTWRIKQESIAQEMRTENWQKLKQRSKPRGFLTGLGKKLLKRL